jgi:hypothetical protein
MARGDKQFARIEVSKVIRQLEQVGKAAGLAGQDLQMELAEAGRDEMVRLIETRGTNIRWEKKWKGRKSGTYKQISSPGRIDSGDMRDAVGVRFERGAQQTNAAFGWIRNFENYFGYQDQGFYHVKANRMVEGMFALRDARQYVRTQVLPRLVKKYENRIRKGIY